MLTKNKTMKNNKLKSLFLILILITNIAFAQKVHVSWTDFYKTNKGTMELTRVEIAEKMYFLIDESKFDHNPIFKVARFDKDLHLEKIVLMPSRFEGEKIKDIDFSVSGTDLIITGKYYETKGTNRLILLKAVVDKDLTNPIIFEPVIDIETQSTLVRNYVMRTTFLKNNKVMIKTSPREGVKERNIYKFEIFDDKYINKEWSAELDLTDLLNDFEEVSSKFTNKYEYVFLLRSKQKFMKKTKDEYIFCKFTKEKGIETKPFDFGENKFSIDVDMIFDEYRNAVYIKNTFSGIGSKNNEFIVKKFNISNMTEEYSKTIDFGSKSQKCFKGTLGLLWPYYSFEDYTLQSFKINGASGQLQIIGELIKPFSTSTSSDGKQTQNNGANGNIIVVNIDSIGNYVTLVIPHEVKTTSFFEGFSTYYLTEYQDKTCIMFYDSDKNAANALCNENTKTDYIKDNEKNELYMVLIDKNNKVEKIKPEKSFKGDGKYIKKYKNFELTSFKKLSNNRYLVKNGSLFAILTIE
jgi:hypothetical protein